MNESYKMVNKCLALLMRCDMRAADKLRVEGRLIHMKKLLVRIPLPRAPLSESSGCAMELEHLLDQISEIFETGCDSKRLARMLRLMDNIETMVVH